MQCTPRASASRATTARYCGVANGLVVGSQMSKSITSLPSGSRCDPEDGMFRSDAPEVVVRRGGRDAAEESADFEFPAPEVGAQHLDLVVVTQFLCRELLHPAPDDELTFVG